MRSGFVAVDWGTTNRRWWSLDGDGHPGEEGSDDRGILDVDDYPAEVRTLRER